MCQQSTKIKNAYRPPDGASIDTGDFFLLQPVTGKNVYNDFMVFNCCETKKELPLTQIVDYVLRGLMGQSGFKGQKLGCICPAMARAATPNVKKTLDNRKCLLDSSP